MAQRTATKARVEYCPACIKPTPIESEQTFSFGDSTYRLRACDLHADQFLSDLFKWARMSTLLESSDSAALKPATPAPARPRRSGKLAYSVLPEIPVHVVQSPPEDDDTIAPAVAQPRYDLTLPINHGRWSFSDHAKKRAAERNVNKDEALWCAEHPDITRPSVQHLDCLVYKRGAIQVVANPITFEILTVWDSRIDSDVTMNQELEFQNAS